MIRRALGCATCLVSPVLILALIVAGIFLYPDLAHYWAQFNKAAGRDLAQIRRATAPSPSPPAHGSAVVKVEINWDGKTICSIVPSDSLGVGGTWYECGSSGYLDGAPFRFENDGPLEADLTVSPAADTGTEVRVLREWR